MLFSLSKLPSFHTSATPSCQTSIHSNSVFCLEDVLVASPVPRGILVDVSNAPLLRAARQKRILHCRSTPHSIADVRGLGGLLLMRRRRVGVGDPSATQWTRCPSTPSARGREQSQVEEVTILFAVVVLLAFARSLRRVPATPKAKTARQRPNRKWPI